MKPYEVNLVWLLQWMLTLANSEVPPFNHTNKLVLRDGNDTLFTGSNESPNGEYASSIDGQGSRAAITIPYSRSKISHISETRYEK